MLVIKLPKSCAFPVDAIVIKSIVSVGFGPGSALPPANIPRMPLPYPVIPLLASELNYQNLVASPVDAMVT